LERKEYRDSIDRILETSAQKSWEVRISENPSVSETRRENSRIATATAD